MESRLHPAVKQTVLNLVAHTFPSEILFYTHPDMRTTAHDAGAAEALSFTAALQEEKMLTAKPKTGDRFTELERTLTALYCILLLLDLPAAESYEYFLYAQKKLPADRQLTRENYEALYELYASIVSSNAQERLLLIYFIIYSDFGKSPILKELLAPFKDRVDLSLGPDDLIVNIFGALTDNEIEQVLPSFSKLSDNNKARLKSFYPLMQPCFGHIFYFERGRYTFEVTAWALKSIALEERAHALKLVFLAQLGDGLGAQGQAKITGSATCTNDFFRAYKLMHDSLLAMELSLREQSPLQASQQSFTANASTRAQWLGLSYDNVQDELLVRMGCMLRCPDDAGSLLTLFFMGLPKPQQTILVQQLSFEESGVEGWPRVDYLASAPLNVSQIDMLDGRTEAGIAAGFKVAICFAMLLDHIRKVMGEKLDSQRAISLGEVAFLATKFPQDFLPENFKPSQYYYEPKESKILKLQSPLSSLGLLSAAKPPAPARASVSSSSSHLPDSNIFRRAGAN
jgi:hypothetical protein